MLLVNIVERSVSLDARRVAEAAEGRFLAMK